MTQDSRTRRTGRASRTGLFVFVVCSLAVLATVALGANQPVTRDDWKLAGFLIVAAAFAQLFVVVTPQNQSYHLTPGLILAAALLLPPYLIALVVVCQHVPEWIKVRYPWVIQTFNIGNYAVAALCASLTFDAVSRLPVDSIVGGDVSFFVSALAAALFFVIVQHLNLSLVLRYARGHSFSSSGLFTFRSLSMDVVLSLIGVVFVHLWADTPVLAAVALSPLLLLHRTLALPKLEAEARQDSKTALYNARHFTEALDEAIDRARRLDTPLSLLVADLDLLRDVNNRYGHLAGDAVLVEAANIFRAHVRPGDVAARFGGEEFCILLLDTEADEALAIAERIRESVETTPVTVDTAAEAISVTVSVGVATFPAQARDARQLLHRADIAAYRAKAHGRNRVVAYGAALELLASQASAGPASEKTAEAPRPDAAPIPEMVSDRGSDLIRSSIASPVPNNLAPARGVGVFVTVVGALGAVAGVAGLVLGSSSDATGLLLLIVLIAAGQIFAADVLDRGRISISAVGCLAGAALVGPRAALPLALAVCAAEWMVHRMTFHKLVFNCAVLTLSGLVGAAVYSQLPNSVWVYTAAGALAGVAYYVVNIGLLTTVIALETHDRWISVFRTRFEWLLLYYMMYGVIGAMLAVAYQLEGALGLIVFSAPLVLVRKAQADYIKHSESSTVKLRDAAATIERQNETLIEANALLRTRATAAMESLVAAIDARDSYTAGHSRRVQEIARAVGRELGLEGRDLEAVSFAAMFHDIGKLGVRDDVLLKQGPLDEDGWAEMRRHPEEGERIIAHLGFLADSTPAIRHHHERFDGSGYPDGLRGEEIPIAARILHVADALDSMLSPRVYRPALPLEYVLGELRRGRGSQSCPACIDALSRVIAQGVLDALLVGYRSSVAA